MIELYEQLLNTALNAEIPILSDEKCCQLLAIVYVVGDENNVFHAKFSADVHYAQRKVGIVGGAQPKSALIKKISILIKDMEEKAMAGRKPEWVLEVERKYKVMFDVDSYKNGGAKEKYDLWVHSSKQ